MIGQFFLTSFASVAIGLIVGLLCSYFFKVCYFMRNSEVIDTAVVYCFGLIAYLLGDKWFSGVISVLVCGIVMSHYLHYNLTERGQALSG
jgi:NhaP-type Na+/H+ or K+/H+ antiporter